MNGPPESIVETRFARLGKRPSRVEVRDLCRVNANPIPPVINDHLPLSCGRGVVAGMARWRGLLPAWNSVAPRRIRRHRDAGRRGFFCRVLMPRTVHVGDPPAWAAGPHNFTKWSNISMPRRQTCAGPRPRPSRLDPEPARRTVWPKLAETPFRNAGHRRRRSRFRRAAPWPAAVSPSSRRQKV